MILIIVVVVVLLAGWGIREATQKVEHHDLVEQERGNPQLAEQKQQRQHERRFVRSVSIPAIRAYQKNYQVLPSIVIAQAIVESNWGTSKLYRVAHNPFGIKGKYHGRSVTYETAEYVNGKKKWQKAAFRKYPSLETAIMDHDRALNDNFIHKNHVMSYVTDAKLLKKNNYATDPQYSSKLIRIIKQYHLNRYDLKAIN